MQTSFPLLKHLLRYKSTQTHTWYNSLCTSQGRVSSAAWDYGSSSALTSVQCVPHSPPLALFPKLFFPILTSSVTVMLVVATVSPVRVCDVV